MPRLTATTHSELIAGLRSHGFEGPYAGGKHRFMISGELRLTIPNPHRGEIGAEPLGRILKQAGITREQWLKR